jgi:hypothetical protein
LFTPLETTALIGLTAAFLYFRWRQKKAEGSKKPAFGAGPVQTTRDGSPKPPKPAKKPEEVYAGLRKEALETSPMSVGMAGQTQDDEPYGMLMEMSIANSVVTLACFGSGDASVFYQTGGGMVGGVSHEPVRKAAKEFVAQAHKAMPRMKKTADYPLPGPDSVRFYALTPKGIFTTETSRQSLSESQNALSALFYSGQEVVSQMRQVQEERRSEARR